MGARPRREWIPRGPSAHVWAEPEHLWTRSFILLGTSNFCLAMVFYLFMPTMAQYTRQAFGADAVDAGIATGMLIVGAIVARVFAGKYLDIVGRKKMLIAATLVYSLFSGAQAVAPTLGMLEAARFVAGLGFGAASTAMSASVQGVIPPRRRGEGTGWFGLSSTLATAAGPLLGLTIGHHWGIRASFLVGTVFCLFGTVFALGVRLPRVEVTPEQRRAAHSYHPREVVETSALPIAVLMTLLGTAYSGVLTFLGPFTTEAGFAEAAGLFFLGYAVTTVTCRPLTGRLLDLRGDRIVMYPTLLAFAGSMALLAVADSTGAVLASSALCGVGFGTLMSSAQAIVAALAPPHRIGLATSTFFLLFDVGTGLGPMFLGVVVTAVGYRGMYGVLAVVVLLALPLYHLVHGRRGLGPLARMAG
ncbi:Predicted arabinose efflux permease, MFS family [Austwickia chelonae]|uniref:Putative major facilitator superfamily transporter n=1 Tax=Austwickia chelonae NBRC 105200 TaxID=1184607 RepID=K6VVI8_9MICO|nr:MFS transporter [Austwickia chelonae]GAB79360.1 putative major facilitator superfamily transporter [Austwickia chelonae NBRC 105200]SEW43905.1 Predicted arabinose efflux permease, MFS family [Austwickia chelonae]